MLDRCFQQVMGQSHLRGEDWMQRTKLYEAHVALGGRMVPFAGWELPVQYATGPSVEHAAVRSAAGLFDIDHMGRFEVRGADAEAYLQYVQVRDISHLQVWDAHYSLLTYDDGAIVDDIFIYRLPERWLVVVNASNRQKDMAWLQAHTHGYAVSVEDISDQSYMLALQGPKAEAILQRMTESDLSQVATRTAIETTVAGVEMLLGRTGYTGEDGFEIYLPAEEILLFWEKLLDEGKADGLIPCGLAARDSLRFEACMPLYGHEINANTNPYEARLGWVVSLEKPAFLGRQSLLKAKLESPGRLLIGFEMVERAVPREEYPILANGAVIGHVTTGMKSPTLDRFLGMGYVTSGHHRLGTEIDIMVRDKPRKARVVKRPFYQPRYKS
jgi:aminomethyltransferase